MGRAEARETTLQAAGMAISLYLLCLLMELPPAFSSLSPVDVSEHMARWTAAAAAASDEDAASSTSFVPPLSASEWYTVTIADVPVGYMHTTTAAQQENLTVQT